MNPRSAGKNRRRQSTTAILAALSLFAALIAGSALRPQLAAAALPEPAAWTHVQRQTAQPISHLDHGVSPGSTPTNKKPTNKKPFHSSWMTRDVTTKWPPLSLPSGWPALPVSFAPLEFQPDRAHWAAAVPAADNRDPLTQFCVARC